MRSTGRSEASSPATLVAPAAAPASPSSGSHDVGTTGGGGSSYVDGMDSNTGTTAGAASVGNGYVDYVFR